MEIEQDYEVFDGGELGSRVDCFWAVGHGLDHHDFMVAVIDHCIEWGASPSFSHDDAPVEMWQVKIPDGDTWVWERSIEKPDRVRASDAQAVTVLDLERRRPGAPKCSVHGCREPWSSGPTVQTTASDEFDVRLAVEFRLCRAHQKLLPDPVYRLAFIPVGATITLPPEGQVATAKRTWSCVLGNGALGACTPAMRHPDPACGWINR